MNKSLNEVIFFQLSRMESVLCHETQWTDVINNDDDDNVNI